MVLALIVALFIVGMTTGRSPTCSRRRHTLRSGPDATCPTPDRRAGYRAAMRLRLAVIVCAIGVIVFLAGMGTGALPRLVHPGPTCATTLNLTPPSLAPCVVAP